MADHNEVLGPVETSVKKFMDDWERAGRINCPHCDKVYTDEEYQHVSYHGEESQCEVTCEHCDKPFWLEERVRRTYATAPTRAELDEI